MPTPAGSMFPYIQHQATVHSDALCYDSKKLEQHLNHSGIRCLLQKSGYNADSSTPELLAELCRRVSESSSFPHEIGLFIGYPDKDVAAFMGLVKIPFSCQGPWKIYGKPDISLDLAETYRNCRIRMDQLLKKAVWICSLTATVKAFF